MTLALNAQSLQESMQVILLKQNQESRCYQVVVMEQNESKNMKHCTQGYGFI